MDYIELDWEKCLLSKRSADPDSRSVGKGLISQIKQPAQALPLQDLLDSKIEPVRL